MEKWKEHICPHCKKNDTYPCGIKKGDYLCNKCGEHFNIYEKYILPKFIETKRLIKKLIESRNEKAKRQT